MQFYYKQFFTNDTVNEYLKNDLAIDGTTGGLILGPSHADGGIYILANYGYGYYLIAEYEGFEFLLNPFAKKKHSNYFDLYNRYNEDKTESFDEYVPDDSIKIIDTRIEKNNDFNSKFIILDIRGQCELFNKYSTRIYLAQLNRANMDCIKFKLSDPIYDFDFKKQRRQRLGKFWFIKQFIK